MSDTLIETDESVIDYLWRAALSTFDIGRLPARSDRGKLTPRERPWTTVQSAAGGIVQQANVVGLSEPEATRMGN
jgi:hypothetical protein